MRVSTRIVFTIYIIVVVLLCLFLLGTMYGLIPTDNLALAVKTVIKGGLEYKVIYTIIFAAMAVIGVILIFTATMKKRGVTATVNSSETGNVQISNQAVAQLAKNYMSRFEDIKEEKSFIGFKNDGVDMLFRIQTKPDVDIPALTSTIQNGLAEHVTSHTGLKVNSVKLYVTSVNDPADQKRDGGQK